MGNADHLPDMDWGLPQEEMHQLRDRIVAKSIEEAARHAIEQYRAITGSGPVPEIVEKVLMALYQHDVITDL